MPTFAALDFETADYGADSACAIGLVKVSDRKILSKEHHLIKPPRRDFVFTYIHGITWEHVHKKPTFKKLWPAIEEYLSDVDFIAAHNARFDKNVLSACAASAGITLPDYRFVCTVKLARKTWDIYPTKLPDVCHVLDIELDHHNALSDAEACARIVMAALKRDVEV